MSRDAASAVLSGLLSGDVGLIDEVQRGLSQEHFVDPTLRALYELILTYRGISGGVLHREAVEQFTSGMDAGSAAVYREAFDALAAEAVTPDVVRWHAHELRRTHERRLTQIALREASDILAGSISEEPDRLGRPGRTWSGASDAREYLAARLGEIAAEVAVSEAPAADVLREGRQILEDYVRASQEDKSRRPRLGIPRFDDLTHGLARGELIMVAAGSGCGKTQLCTALAYHASQYQGLHVFFATSETVRTTVRSRLVARHSRHEKFEGFREQFGLPHGLDSQLIDRGELNPEHVPFLAQVAIDWGAQGASSSEGTCYVAQMPHGQTMAAIAAQIEARARVARPDLVIIDYLALMSSSRRLQSTREELSTIIKEAAHFAVDAFKGEGVPVVSPWQLNRESQREFARGGQLDQNGLAETAEAVSSADLVVALVPEGARDGRMAGLRLDVLKNRDGQVLMGSSGIPVTVDYAASWFEQRVGAADGMAEPEWGAADPSMASLVGL